MGASDKRERLKATEGREGMGRCVETRNRQSFSVNKTHWYPSPITINWWTCDCDSIHHQVALRFQVQLLVPRTSLYISPSVLHPILRPPTCSREYIVVPRSISPIMTPRFFSTSHISQIISYRSPHLVWFGLDIFYFRGIMVLIGCEWNFIIWPLLDGEFLQGQIKSDIYAPIDSLSCKCNARPGREQITRFYYRKNKRKFSV